MKLNTNLFIAEDGYNQAYSVIIFDGNIKPLTPNVLPGCKDERVNFQYQYAPTYADISNNKVNTRFLYPYSGRYKKEGNEGFCAAYANLNIIQRAKLSLINKTSVFHKHPIPIIFIILNVIGLIPLWIPFLSPNVQESSISKNSQIPKEIRYNKVEGDSFNVKQIDSIKLK